MRSWVWFGAALSGLAAVAAVRHVVRYGAGFSLPVRDLDAALAGFNDTSLPATSEDAGTDLGDMRARASRCAEKFTRALDEERCRVRVIVAYEPDGRAVTNFELIALP